MHETSEPSYCTQCGKTVFRSAQFCDQCGSPTGQVPGQALTQREVAGKSNAHIPAAVLKTVLFLIFAVLVVWWWMQGPEDDTKSKATNPSRSTDESPGRGVASAPATMDVASCLERGKRSSEVDEYEIASTIVGTVKNNCGRDFSYVEIEFKLFDRKGNVLGTAIANQANLRAGEPWRYKAPGAPAYSNRFESITAY